MGHVRTKSENTFGVRAGSTGSASGVHGYERLQKADPDYLIPSVKYLPELIFNQIQSRLMRGDQPGEGLAYDPTDADIRLGRRMRTEAITQN